jgi:hypothetical protein
MDGKHRWRKRLISAGTLCSALGFGLLTVYGYRNPFGIALFSIGIGLYILSNFFRGSNTKNG